MECRKLEIILVSATNLPNIRSLGTMKVYARVSLKGEPKTTQKTLVDTQGETNPRWNFPVQFTVSESSLHQPGVTVVVKLLCKRSLGDRLVGEVNMEVKTLFDLGLKGDKVLLSYGVVGTNKGRLNVLYSFGEKDIVSKPSGWKSAMDVGFFVVVGGALILLSDGDDNDKPRKASRVHGVDEYCEDEEVFYDAKDD